MSYYHFTRWDLDQIDPNQQFNTSSWEESNYWTYKLTGEFSEPTTLFQTDEGKLIRQQLQSMGLLEYFIYAKYTSELFKEFVFEEVRISCDINLPSRKKCMFLIDKRNDPYKVARAMGFNTSIYNLAEIKVEVEKPKLLMTDMQLLNCNIMKYPQLVTQAREYWNGTADLNEYCEVLYEGAFMVSKAM